MPKYFFNIENGAYAPDSEGVALSGVAEAQAQATTMAGEMLREGSARLWETGEWRLKVTDEAGGAVFVLSLLAEKGAT